MSGSENHNSDEQNDETGCDLKFGRWDAKGKPVEAEYTAKEGEQYEDIEIQCAIFAAKTAFSTLQRRIGIDLEKQNAKYISVSAPPGIVVEVGVAVKLDSNGNVKYCPNSDFHSDLGRQKTPELVTITADIENKQDKTYKCAHEIIYKVTTIREV